MPTHQHFNPETKSCCSDFIEETSQPDRQKGRQKPVSLWVCQQPNGPAGIWVFIMQHQAFHGCLSLKCLTKGQWGQRAYNWKSKWEQNRGKREWQRRQSDSGRHRESNSPKLPSPCLLGQRHAYTGTLNWGLDHTIPCLWPNGTINLFLPQVSWQDKLCMIKQLVLMHLFIEVSISLILGGVN